MEDRATKARLRAMHPQFYCDAPPDLLLRITSFTVTQSFLKCLRGKGFRPIARERLRVSKTLYTRGLQPPPLKGGSGHAHKCLNLIPQWLRVHMGNRDEKYPAAVVGTYSRHR